MIYIRSKRVTQVAKTTAIVLISVLACYQSSLASSTSINTTNTNNNNNDANLVTNYSNYHNNNNATQQIKSKQPPANQLDAPKYYNLNSLLYKKTSTSQSGDGKSIPTFIKPKDRIDNEEADNNDENSSSVDDLIRSMKRRQHTISTNRGKNDEPSSINDEDEQGATEDEGQVSNRKKGINNFIGEEDEATIQRKSTNIDRDSDDAADSSLRSDQSSRLKLSGGSSASSLLSRIRGNVGKY